MPIVPVHARKIAPVIAKEIAPAQLSAFHRPLNNITERSLAINILRGSRKWAPTLYPLSTLLFPSAENGTLQHRPKQRLIRQERTAIADPIVDPADLVGQRTRTTYRHAARQLQTIADGTLQSVDAANWTPADISRGNAARL
jgi:hypothetical protein